MNMRSIIVGSNAAVPTSQYGTSGVFIQIGGSKILLDCGEGTQQRLMRYGGSINVDAIFLTHFDTDHTLGLPGLIRTLGMNNRGRPLDIYASDNIVDNINSLIFGPHGGTSYEINIHGFDKSGQSIAEFGEFDVTPFKTEHDKSSYGFVVKENEKDGHLDAQKLENEYGVEPSEKYQRLKEGQSIRNEKGEIIEPSDVIGSKREGRKLVYTGDCMASDNVIRHAEDSDLLIHESTFHSRDSKKADKTSHSTSKQAGMVASSSNAQHLVLTHISPRYEDNEEILKEDAQKVYDGNVSIGRDGFEKIIKLD